MTDENDEDTKSDPIQWYPCACGAEHDTPTCPFGAAPPLDTTGQSDTLGLYFDPLTGAATTITALSPAVEACMAIVELAGGWDADGVTGPRPPLSWESVARIAIDRARAALMAS